MPTTYESVVCSVRYLNVQMDSPLTCQCVIRDGAKLVIESVNDSGQHGFDSHIHVSSQPWYPV